MKDTFTIFSIIANNIHRLRNNLKLSQKELANNLGVSQKTISLWEQRQRCPKLENILTICNYFDIKLDDFIGNSSMDI